MKTPRWILGGAVALALAAGATPADAQSIAGMRVFHFGVKGGAGMPLGDFASTDPDGLAATSGFNAGALLSIKPPVMPIGLRVEGSYDRFGVDLASIPEAEGMDAKWNVLSGTVNAVVGASSGPYLIGGVGMYKTELKLSADGSSVGFDDTQLGFNGGVGLRFGLGLLSTFVEARYHTTTIELDLEETGTTESQRINFVPISVGIVF